MSAEITENDRVMWTWGEGQACGTVQSIFTQRTTRTIDGTEVTRNGSSGNPALYIDTDDASNVLKLASEVEKIN